MNSKNRTFALLWGLVLQCFVFCLQASSQTNSLDVNTVGGRVIFTFPGAKAPMIVYQKIDTCLLYYTVGDACCLNHQYLDYCDNEYVEDTRMTPILVYLKGNFEFKKLSSLGNKGSIEFVSDTAAVRILQHWHGEFCDQAMDLLGGRLYVSMDEAKKVFRFLPSVSFKGYHHVSIHRNRRYIYLYASKSGVYTPPESIVVDLTEDSRKIKRFIKRGKYRHVDKSISK